MKKKIGVFTVFLILQQFSTPTQGQSETQCNDSFRELWGKLSTVVNSYQPTAMGCNDPPVTWNSLAMIQIASTSSIRYSGTLSYNLPSEVPSTAKEVLLFVNFEHGYSGPDRTTYFKIYTQEDDSHYEKYASLHTYSQSAWNTNSENMWLPVTSNRRVYVAKQGNTNLTRNLHFYMYVIGYR